MEATARTVAEQQRILKRSEQKTLAEARADAAAHARREQLIAEEERLAAEEAERAARAAIALERASRAAAAERARALATVTGAPVVSPLRRRRLRRARALTSGCSCCPSSDSSRASPRSSPPAPGRSSPPPRCSRWARSGCSAGSRVLRPSSRRPARGSPLPPLRASYDHAELDAAQPQVQRRRQETWTPRPLPKPLHLSRGTIAASAMASHRRRDRAAAFRRTRRDRPPGRRTRTGGHPASPGRQRSERGAEHPVGPGGAGTPVDAHRHGAGRHGAEPLRVHGPRRRSR